MSGAIGIDGINEDASIMERISDVEKAIATVRTELIDKLPKMKRSGRLVLDDLEVEVTDVFFRIAQSG